MSLRCKFPYANWNELREEPDFRFSLTKCKHYSHIKVNAVDGAYVVIKDNEEHEASTPQEIAAIIYG